MLKIRCWARASRSPLVLGYEALQASQAGADSHAERSAAATGTAASRNSFDALGTNGIAGPPAAPWTEGGPATSPTPTGSGPGRVTVAD